MYHSHVKELCRARPLPTLVAVFQRCICQLQQSQRIKVRLADSIHSRPRSSSKASTIYGCSMPIHSMCVCSMPIRSMPSCRSMLLLLACS